MKEFLIGDYRHLNFVCRHFLHNRVYAKVENVRAGINGCYSRLLVDESQFVEARIILEAYKKEISWQSEPLKVQYAAGLIDKKQEDQEELG